MVRQSPTTRVVFLQHLLELVRRIGEASPAGTAR